MNAIHISTARKILQAPEPVDIKCWTKSGAILELTNAIPLRYNFYEGTQQFKILTFIIIKFKTGTGDIANNCT